MAELDVDALIARYRERAAAVGNEAVHQLREMTTPVIEAENDFLDFSLVAAASWAVEGGDLVLRIPLSR